MFQMSDKEMERRTRDAEAVRRRMVTGEKSSPEANPLHADTASEFRQRYGGALYQKDNSNPSSFNSDIQNVTVTHQARPRSRKDKKRLLPQSSSDYFENQTINDTPKQNQNVPTLGRGRKTLSDQNAKEKSMLKKFGYAAGQLYGKTVGRGLMTSAYLWTNFIYAFLQLWLGIIAAVAIGFVFLIEAIVGSGTTKAIFDALMTMIGVDWDFYLVALLMYMLVVCVCYIQLFGVALQAKGLGLHPLGGKGAFFKTGSFLLCFVMYWIPLVNCLPLVNLYIFSIQVAPR
jgi:hypothetical protein